MSSDTYGNEVNPLLQLDMARLGYGRDIPVDFPMTRWVLSMKLSSGGVMTFRKPEYSLMCLVSCYLLYGRTMFITLLSGYTIIENVYIVNGTVYLMADTYQDFPPLDAIVLTMGEGFRQWKILSAEQGRQLLGPHGSVCVSPF